MSKTTYPRRNLGPGEPWGREVEKFAEGSEKRFTWLEAAVNRLNLSISALQGALQQQITHPGTPLPRFVGRTLYVDDESGIPDNRNTDPVVAVGYGLDVQSASVAIGHDIEARGGPSIIVSDGAVSPGFSTGIVMFGSDTGSYINQHSGEMRIRSIMLGDANKLADISSMVGDFAGSVVAGSLNDTTNGMNAVFGLLNQVPGATNVALGLSNLMDFDLFEEQFPGELAQASISMGINNVSTSPAGVAVGVANVINPEGNYGTDAGSVVASGMALGAGATVNHAYSSAVGYVSGASTTARRQLALGGVHVSLLDAAPAQVGDYPTPLPLPNQPSDSSEYLVYGRDGDLWLATKDKRVNLSAGGGGGGEPGADGKSAYQIAVDNGFVGTEEQWLASLVGPEGDPGLDGDPGPKGDSAYQVAVNNGFIGTEQEWLESLVGPKGEKGDPGSGGGGGGADGKSAYEIAVENGFVGTEQEWLDSLVGPRGEPGSDGEPGTNGADGIDGIDGTDGKSAYQVAVDAGFVGTEQEWLDSLKGPQGDQGIQGNPGQQGPPGESALATSGTVTLAAPSGGGEVEVGVIFPEDAFSLPPRVLVSLSTRVPHTATVNICADTITETGAQIVLNRSDNEPTDITWVAVPADGDVPPVREPYPDTFYPNELYPA